MPSAAAAVIVVVVVAVDANAMVLLRHELITLDMILLFRHNDAADDIK